MCPSVPPLQTRFPKSPRLHHYHFPSFICALAFPAHLSTCISFPHKPLSIYEHRSFILLAVRQRCHVLHAVVCTPPGSEPEPEPEPEPDWDPHLPAGYFSLFLSCFYVDMIQPQDCLDLLLIPVSFSFVNESVNCLCLPLCLI